MAKRTPYLPAMIVAAAAFVACVAAALAVAQQAQAAFPGQNGRLVFSARTGVGDARQDQIWVVNSDGTGEKQLTDGVSYRNIDPAFSPDGTKIAWTREVWTASDVWIMNADGTGKRMVVRAASDPAFSPDGAKIAFVRRDPSGGSELYWKALEGGAVARRLTDNLHWQEDPAWSPDGRRIAYALRQGVEGCSYCLQPGGDLFTIRADGTSRKRLTNLPDYLGVRSPNWGPAGAAIVFRVDNDRQEDARDLWTVKPDGTSLATMVSDTGLDPTFSPDGRKIAFVAGDVTTVNRDGTGRTNVTGQFATRPVQGGLDWGPRP